MGRRGAGARRRIPSAVLLLVFCAGPFGWWAWVQETQTPLVQAGAPAVTLNVTTGMTAADIGRELWTMGLVRHPLVFRALVHFRGVGKQLRAGRYSLAAPLTLNQVVDLLEKGEAERHEVTFPEGLSYEEMATIVARFGVPAQAFLAAAREASRVHDLDPQATDLEGYLFPDTYDIPQGDNKARALVAHMLRRFRAVIAPEEARIQRSGLTLRKLLTLASLVELEAALPEERPRIAAVFLNRLQKGMLLQTDPTVIFALRKAGSYDGNIRKKDLELDSPYNTYRHPGLPPGPIASPGRASLRAVLEPAPVKDLYFVSRNDGSHEFNESLSQHERAVDRYQRQRRRTSAPSASPTSQPPPTPIQ